MASGRDSVVTEPHDASPLSLMTAAYQSPVLVLRIALFIESIPATVIIDIAAPLNAQDAPSALADSTLTMEAAPLTLVSPAIPRPPPADG